MWSALFGTYEDEDEEMEFESPMQQVVRRCTNLQEQIGALEFENQRLKDEAKKIEQVHVVQDGEKQLERERALVEQIEACEKELKESQDVNKRLCEMVSKTSEEETVSEQLRLELDEKLHLVESLRHEKAQVEQHVAQQQDEWSRNCQNLTEARDALESDLHEKEQALMDLRATTEEVEKLRYENSELASQLNLSQESISQLVAEKEMHETSSAKLAVQESREEELLAEKRHLEMKLQEGNIRYKQLEEWCAQIPILEDRINQFASANTSFQEENANLQMQLDALRNESSDLQAKDQLIASLNTEIQEISSANEAYFAENNRLSAQLSETTSSLEMANEQIQRLEHQLQTENSRLTTQLRETTSSLEMAKEHILSLEHQLQQTSGENNRLSAQLSETTSSLEMTKKHVLSLEDQLRGIESRNDTQLYELQNDKEQLMNRVEELSVMNSSLLAESESLRVKFNDELRTQAEDSERLRMLEAQLGEANELESQLKCASESLRSELSYANDVIETMRNESSQRASENATMMQENNFLREKCRNVEEELAVSINKLNFQGEEHSRLEAENEELKHRVSEQEGAQQSRIYELTQQCQHAQNEIHQLTLDKTALQQKNQELETLSSEVSASRRQNEERVQELSTSLAEATTQNDQLRRRNETLMRETEASTLTLNQIQEQIEQLKGKNQALEAQLGEALQATQTLRNHKAKLLAHMKQIPLLKEQVAEFEQLKINNANLLSNMAELNAENDILKHKCYRLTQELSNYVERLPEEDIQTFSSTPPDLWKQLHSGIEQMREDLEKLNSFKADTSF